MKIFNKLKFYVAMGTLTSMVGVAHAQHTQGVNTPNSLEFIKAKSLWFESGNAAGLMLQEMSAFGDIRAFYKSADGDFKRVQQGKKESHFGISSEGGQAIGSGYGWGQFTYDNLTTRDSRFNTAMLDPLREVPYFPVDPNVSDWKRQDYTLKMKIASAPVWERFIFGLDAEYLAKTGAKQVDPRAEQYFYTIQVKPGVATSLGNHQVGINLEYENMIQETRRHTNSDSQTDQNVFVMRGLGNHYTAMIGSIGGLGGFVYNANKFGGEMQYGYKFDGSQWLLNGGYSKRVENVVRDVSKPKKEGSVVGNYLYGRLVGLIGNHNTSRLEINYSNSKSDGIEYVQVLDQTYEVQQWVDIYKSVRSTYAEESLGLRYDFFKTNAQDYQWKVGVSSNYLLSDDLYFLPNSQLKVENLFVNAYGKYNFNFGAQKMLTLAANFTFKNNLSGEYQYGGVNPNSIVITDFMTPDFEYLKQDYYKIGANLSYFSPLGKGRSNGVFVEVGGDYYKPTVGNSNRLFTNVQVGFTF